MQTHIFELSGLSCGHCEQAVRQTVRALDTQAEVQIERQGSSPELSAWSRVSVRSALARSELARALAAEGYPERFAS